MKYKIGQIILFRQFNNFYGKAIKIYNKIKFGEEGFSHVGIIVKVDAGIVIAEALTQGFVLNFWINKYE